MKKSLSKITVWGAFILLSSCSLFDSSEKEAASSASQKHGLSLEERFAWDKKDVEISKEGNVVGGKRSQFEKMMRSGANGEKKEHRFSRKQRQKKSLSGRKVARESSQKKPIKPFYLQKQNSFGQQVARADGQRLSTSSYKTAQASETSRRNLARTLDAETQQRRRLFKKPKIESYKVHQQKTIEETRSILGRED